MESKQVYDAINKTIEDITPVIKQEEVSIVQSVLSGTAMVSGLSGVQMDELLLFDNNVKGMRVVNMVLGEAGEDGRRSVEEDPSSIHDIECDMVVMALGTSPNHEALKESDIELSDRGLIVVDGTKTSLSNVYAGGDAVTGAATVILAMEAGKKAASEIMEALNGN